MELPYKAWLDLLCSNAPESTCSTFIAVGLKNLADHPIVETVCREFQFDPGQGVFSGFSKDAFLSRLQVQSGCTVLDGHLSSFSAASSGTLLLVLQALLAPPNCSGPTADNCCPHPAIVGMFEEKFSFRVNSAGKREFELGHVDPAAVRRELDTLAGSVGLFSFTSVVEQPVDVKAVPSHLLIPFPDGWSPPPLIEEGIATAGVLEPVAAERVWGFPGGHYAFRGRVCREEKHWRALLKYSKASAPVKISREELVRWLGYFEMVARQCQLRGSPVSNASGERLLTCRSRPFVFGGREFGFCGSIVEACPLGQHHNGRKCVDPLHMYAHQVILRVSTTAGLCTACARFQQLMVKDKRFGDVTTRAFRGFRDQLKIFEEARRQAKTIASLLNLPEPSGLTSQIISPSGLVCKDTAHVYEVCGVSPARNCTLAPFTNNDPLDEYSYVAYRLMDWYSTFSSWFGELQRLFPCGQQPVRSRSAPARSHQGGYWQTIRSPLNVANVHGDLSTLNGCLSIQCNNKGCDRLGVGQSEKRYPPISCDGCRFKFHLARGLLLGSITSADFHLAFRQRMIPSGYLNVGVYVSDSWDCHRARLWAATQMAETVHATAAAAGSRPISSSPSVSPFSPLSFSPLNQGSSPSGGRGHAGQGFGRPGSQGPPHPLSVSGESRLGSDDSGAVVGGNAGRGGRGSTPGTVGSPFGGHARREHGYASGSSGAVVGGGGGGRGGRGSTPGTVGSPSGGHARDGSGSSGAVVGGGGGGGSPPIAGGTKPSGSGLVHESGSVSKRQCVEPVQLCASGEHIYTLKLDRPVAPPGAVSFRFPGSSDVYTLRSNIQIPNELRIYTKCVISYLSSRQFVPPEAISVGSVFGLEVGSSKTFAVIKSARAFPRGSTVHVELVKEDHFELMPMVPAPFVDYTKYCRATRLMAGTGDDGVVYVVQPDKDYPAGGVLKFAVDSVPNTEKQGSSVVFPRFCDVELTHSVTKGLGFSVVERNGTWVCDGGVEPADVSAASSASVPTSMVPNETKRRSSSLGGVLGGSGGSGTESGGVAKGGRVGKERGKEAQSGSVGEKSEKEGRGKGGPVVNDKRGCGTVDRGGNGMENESGAAATGGPVGKERENENAKGAKGGGTATTLYRRRPECMCDVGSL